MTLLKSNGKPVSSVADDVIDYDDILPNRWIEREYEQLFPLVNIKENIREYEIEYATPGYTKNEFKIRIAENVLTLSAEREQKKKEEKERFKIKEFSYTSFSRSLILPKNINTDEIAANYTNGILKLNIPKKVDLMDNPAINIKVD